jgi:hypothetical protein
MVSHTATQYPCRGLKFRCSYQERLRVHQLAVAMTKTVHGASEIGSAGSDGGGYRLSAAWQGVTRRGQASIWILPFIVAAKPLDVPALQHDRERQDLADPRDGLKKTELPV